MQRSSGRLPQSETGNDRDATDLNPQLPKGAMNIGVAAGGAEPSSTSLNMFFPLSIWAPQSAQVVAKALGNVAERVTEHAMLENYNPITGWWKTFSLFSPPMFNSVCKFADEAKEKWLDKAPCSWAWEPFIEMLKTFASEAAKSSENSMALLAGSKTTSQPLGDPALRSLLPPS